MSWDLVSKIIAYSFLLCLILLGIVIIGSMLYQLIMRAKKDLIIREREELIAELEEEKLN